MLQNEIKILRKLDHPNIVGFHSAYQNDDKCYLLIDYIEGLNLREYIKKKGTMTIQESLIILQVLLKIVDYLNNLQIIHRDFKPDNILIYHSEISLENIYLIDFGLSITKNNSNDRMLCGTPGYIAPEIFNEKDQVEAYFEKCDLFGIGIIWYFCLFGKIPYDGYSDLKFLLKKNKDCDFSFEKSKKFEMVRDYMMVFLEKNPKKRGNIKKILNSDFFFDIYSKVDHFEEIDEIDGDRLHKNMQSYNE